MQLAVNAYQHDAAARVHLHVGPGPTFSIEWPAAARPAPAVRSHRHALRRERWGWGYVQLVADALGAVAMPPGPAGAGMTGAALSLGSPRLGLPLACVRDGRIERASQAWDEDPAMPRRGQAAAELHDLVAQAWARPGQIAYRDLHRARLRGDRTWVALAPESGSSRVRDLVAGLDHERALWSAPEPHATRVSALATLLRVAMGEPWPSVPPSVWADVMPEACAALGVATPPDMKPLCPPDPRVAAFLLAETGGRLTCVADEVVLVPAHLDSPLHALWPRTGEPFRINP
jgi:hypothetical protein